MAVTIADGDLSKGGAVIETSGGTKYGVFVVANVLEIYKDVDVLPTATYYFDCSDAGPTDPQGNWTDDANGFDGSISTSAYTTIGGASYYLHGEGTNAPASGDTIVEVEARLYGKCESAPLMNVMLQVRTDGWAESLLSQSITLSATPAWSNYYKLSTPTGGWTWGKIQALEVRYLPLQEGGKRLDMYRAEIRVGYRSLVDSDTATTIHGGGNIASVDAALRSDGDIDIVCAGTDSAQARDISYAIFDTSAGTLGAWEQAAAYVNGNPTNPWASISIALPTYPISCT